MTEGGTALPMMLVIAAALAGVVAWELRTPPEEPAPPQARAPALPDAVPRPVAGAGQAAEWAATLLARPLFSPERRPPGPGAAAAVLPDAPLPRLTAILVTPEGRSAIFAGQPQPVIIREGGILGRFSVQRIEPGQVTLSGPDGARILRPTFDAASTPPPPSPLPGLPALPGARPVNGGPPPPIPGTFPSLADAPQDAMPFETMTNPSGAAILREQARREPGPAAPR